MCLLRLFPFQMRKDILKTKENLVADASRNIPEASFIPVNLLLNQIVVSRSQELAILLLLHFLSSMSLVQDLPPFPTSAYFLLHS